MAFGLVGIVDGRELCIHVPVGCMGDDELATLIFEERVDFVSARCHFDPLS
jgi:hypothetical protein